MKRSVLAAALALLGIFAFHYQWKILIGRCLYICDGFYRRVCGD